MKLDLEKEVFYMPLYFNEEYLTDINYVHLMILSLKIAKGEIDNNKVFLLNRENGDKILFDKNGFIINTESNILVNQVTDIIRQKFRLKNE